MLKIFLFLISIYLALIFIGYLKRKRFEERAVLTGGGSSGHVYPAIAIGRMLAPEVNKLLFIGAKKRIEEKVVPKENIDLRLINVSPFPQKKIQFLPFFLNLFLGSLQASFYLYQFQPKFIIATGGFVSAPTIFSAYILNRLFLLNSKIFLHEQNVTPGKLNQFAFKMANKVLLTFPQTKRFFKEKAVICGYPLRKRDVLKDRNEIFKKWKIPAEKKVIFAFGGSQGSRTINRAIVDSLRYFLKRDDVFIILGCGFKSDFYDGYKDVRDRLKNNYNEGELERIKSFFIYEPYIYEIFEVFSISEVVISRSGAGTIFEICDFGVPSILIPKIGLSNEHQVMNALVMEEVGASKLIFERVSEEDGIPFVNGERIYKEVIEIIDSEEKKERMRKATKSVFFKNNSESLFKEAILYDKQENINYSDFEFKEPLKPSKLLTFLESNRREKGDNFDINVLFSPSHIEFYGSLISSLLNSSNWWHRNLGVKLAFYFKDDEFKKKLIKMILSDEKGTFLRRIFGERKKEVGFIRRNIFYSLKNYELTKEEVKNLFLKGIDDDYYEVRSASLIFAQNFAEKLYDEEIRRKLRRKLLCDKEFEVKKEAVLLLGEIGSEEDVSDILKLSDDYYWQVREAVLIAIKRLLEREVIKDINFIRKNLENFNITATDFKPYFSIKDNYRRLMSELMKVEK